MSITSTELHRSRPLRSSPLAGPSVVSLEQPARPVSAHSPLSSPRPASLYANDARLGPALSRQSVHSRRPATAPGPARPRSELSPLNDDQGLSPNLHVRYSSSLLSVPSGPGTRASSILIDPEAGTLKNPRPILKHRTSFRPSSSLSSSTSSVDEVRFSAADKGKDKLNASGSRMSNSHVVPPANTGQGDESWYTFSPYATTPKFTRLGLASAGVVMPVSAKDLARSKSSASRTRHQSGGPSTLSRNVSSASSSMRGRSLSTSIDEHDVLTSGQQTRPQPQPLQQQQQQQQHQQRPQVPAPSSLPLAAAWLNVPPPARTRIGKGDFKAIARCAAADTVASAPVATAEPSASSSRSSTSTSVSTRRTSVSVSNCNSAASSSTSLPSSASYQQQQQLYLPPPVKPDDGEKAKKQKRKTLSLSLGLRSWKSLRDASALERGSTCTDAAKDQDEGFIIPLPSPPPAARFPDSPTSPNFATATAPAPVAVAVSSPSIREAEAEVGFSSAGSTTMSALSSTAQTTKFVVPRSGSMPALALPARSNFTSTHALHQHDHGATPSSTAVPRPDPAPSALESAPAPVHNKLKKRKSASAILARVKSWRWGAGSSGKGGRHSASVSGADGEGGVEGCHAEDAVPAGADKAQSTVVAAADIPVPAVVVEVDAREEALSTSGLNVSETKEDNVESRQQLDQPMSDLDIESNTSSVPKAESDEADAASIPASSTTSSPSLSPAPAPLSTHLSTLIPSPNLHVSADTVPGYIQSQLAPSPVQAQMQPTPSPAILALVDALAPALPSMNARSFTPAPGSVSTECSSADSEADVGGSDDSVPGCSSASSSDSASTLVSEQHDGEELEGDVRKATVEEDRVEMLVEHSHVDDVFVVDDKCVSAAATSLTSSNPPSAPNTTFPEPPLSNPPPITRAEEQIAPPHQNIITPPSVPLPREQERSRSHTRTRSLSISKPRSGSVRRMWNALMRNSSAAAVDAWAEIQSGSTGSKAADAAEGNLQREVVEREVLKGRGVGVDSLKGDALVTVSIVPTEYDAPAGAVKAIPT